MKQFKLFLLTAFITISAFGALIYSSCRKDKCKGVTCQNGGTCNDGSCVCPSGYSGNFCENSSITYTNDTYTPINITVGGSAAVINAGTSVSFIGAAGTAVNVTAYTSGTTSTGSQVGDLISWSFTDNFPTDGDALTEPLDVSAAYFYLYMKNTNASESINAIYVNYGSSQQTVDNVTVPNDGNVYGIGYYLAYSNTEVYATGSASSYWTWYPAIPNVANATVTLTAN